ncbi:MAG: hypothetical protein ABEJ92_08230 [Halobacteriales archaeon]
MRSPMHSPRTPTPGLDAHPVGRLLAGVSLAALALTVGHLLAVPGLLATLAAFAAVLALPVIATAAAVRVGTAVLEARTPRPLPRRGRSIGRPAESPSAD